MLPTVKSSSPNLLSLKWKPPQFAFQHQDRNDLLYIGIGQVMPEINQSKCPVTTGVGKHKEVPQS